MPNKQAHITMQNSNGDTIHHETHTVFSLMDRLRILFCKKIISVSKINTAQPVNVIYSEAKVTVIPIFKKRILFSSKMERQDTCQEKN